MDELCLQVEKASGSIRYMTRDRKLLFRLPPGDIRPAAISLLPAASLAAGLLIRKDD